MNAAWGVLVVIIFIVMTSIWWSKPSTCRDGYIPSYVGFVGWRCVPGYRPEPSN